MSKSERAKEPNSAAGAPRWLPLGASCAGAWIVVLLLAWALIAPARSTPSTHRPLLPLPVELDGVNVPPAPDPLRSQQTLPAASAAPADGLKTW